VALEAEQSGYFTAGSHEMMHAPAAGRIFMFAESAGDRQPSGGFSKKKYSGRR
jgi:hypothetical protein